MNNIKQKFTKKGGILLSAAMLVVLGAGGYVYIKAAGLTPCSDGVSPSCLEKALLGVSGDGYITRSLLVNVGTDPNGGLKVFGMTTTTPAFSIDASGNAVFKGNVIIGGATYYGIPKVIPATASCSGYTLSPDVSTVYNSTQLPVLYKYYQAMFTSYTQGLIRTPICNPSITATRSYDGTNFGGCNVITGSECSGSGSNPM